MSSVYCFFGCAATNNACLSTIIARRILYVVAERSLALHLVLFLKQEAQYFGWYF